MAQTGKQRRKVSWAVHCERHGKKTMIDIVPWVSVGIPKNMKPTKHTGCPMCNAERKTKNG